MINLLSVINLLRKNSAVKLIYISSSLVVISLSFGLEILLFRLE